MRLWPLSTRRADQQPNWRFAAKLSYTFPTAELPVLSVQQKVECVFLKEKKINTVNQPQ